MQKSSKWSADIGKPIFLEEFGMARNNWENKDKEYPYLSSASTSNKDAYFEVCYTMDKVMTPADLF
jgi:mannan endo-1,4-beta-mannosidase